MRIIRLLLAVALIAGSVSFFNGCKSTGGSSESHGNHSGHSGGGCH